MPVLPPDAKFSRFTAAFTTTRFAPPIMIVAADDIVDKVSPIFATEQFKDCDITAVNKGFQWAHWTNKPKGDPTKTAKNSLVRTDKDPGKDAPACKDVHAFAKISNAAERDIYKLSWLIWCVTVRSNGLHYRAPLAGHIDAASRHSARS